jgi:DNA repair exonuclease SbcCD ATPase subunit
MNITRIEICNYQSYYNVQSFNVANGFNVVLGDNGEGKTKLVESIKWFLSGLSKDTDISLLNKSVYKDLELGNTNSAEIYVELEFYDSRYAQKLVIKKSTNCKIVESGVVISDAIYEGVQSTNKGESIFHEDATYLLREAIPEVIRPYTVFQGEAELNILDNSNNSIESLINIFINENQLKKLQNNAKKILRKAEIAVEKTAQANKKNARILSDLKFKIDESKDRINRLNVRITQQEKDANHSKKRMAGLNDILAQAEEFNIFKDKMKELEQKKARVSVVIKDDYTTYIFDDNYLLHDFRSELETFATSVTKLEQNERRLEVAFQRRVGEEQAVQKIQNALIGDVNPLPIGVPSLNVIQEMLHDEVCKVCNRLAKKGSKEYEYMKDHMTMILKHLGNTDLPDEVLFKSNNVRELSNELVNGYRSKVSSLLTDKKTEYRELKEFTLSRYQELSDLDKRISGLSDKISGITGMTGLSSDTLSRHLNDWQKHSQNYAEKLKIVERLNSTLKEEEAAYNRLLTHRDKLVSDSGVSQYLLTSKEVSEKLFKVFQKVRSNDISSVIKRLEIKTNEIFDKLNVHSFKGYLKISGGLHIQSDEIRVQIEHVVNQGEVFRGANQALETSANIALLLAVVEISKNQNIGSFPIFMDAPVSSFGRKKIRQFMQVMNSVDLQCFVIMKEFLEPDGKGDIKISEDFKELNPEKSFWLKLERPFDQEDLSTVKTIVHEI